MGNLFNSMVSNRRVRINLSIFSLLFFLFLSAFIASNAGAGPGEVSSHQKIANSQGNFTGTLNSGDNFGSAVTSLGDFDGNGIEDIAVGASGSNAVWILFLDGDGKVISDQRISSNTGSLAGTLSSDSEFGSSVSSIGDLDADGIRDIAVGASGDDKVFVLFLNANGTLKSSQEISSNTGGFDGSIDDGVNFGSAVASLGDLDGDGNFELSVGSKQDSSGGGFSGAVWILFLNSDGSVKSQQKINKNEGDFAGNLGSGDRFGTSIASLGDLNGDGITDIAVGAMDDDDGSSASGAVWILFLDSDGTVKANQKISNSEGNITFTIKDSDFFGSAVTSVGDLDGDGNSDIVVGATNDDDESSNSGAVWVLFLRSDGTVKSHQKISNSEGDFKGALSSSDNFGASITSINDLNGDGIVDIVVGATGNDNGNENSGAAWILFLDGEISSTPDDDSPGGDDDDNQPTTIEGVEVVAHQKISNTEGDFNGGLFDNSGFGKSAASLGDFNRDGVTDIAIGADGDGDGGGSSGAVWLLFLNSDGTVKSHQKISDIGGNFSGNLKTGDNFGSSVASLGDFDGDGITDIVVGARSDDDGANAAGAVWILFLNLDGTVKSSQKISNVSGGFGGVIEAVDAFGSSVASIGDLDGDGVTDIAVGAQSTDDSGIINTGAVWILFLNSDGTVKGQSKINNTNGDFNGNLEEGDTFGAGLASLGDLDGDGATDIAVGAIWDDDGDTDAGAVYILFLNSNGKVKRHQKISAFEGNFGIISDDFGRSVASLGDIDEDGVVDIAVGASGDGGRNEGAIYILFLNSLGKVESHTKINETEGNFAGVLDTGDSFGFSVASLGNLDKKGINDIVVGSWGDSDGANRAGAAWVLFMDGVSSETPAPVSTPTPDDDDSDDEPTPAPDETPDDDDEPDNDEPAEANFIADQGTGPAPLTVQFSDLSKNDPTDWLWDFGDGSASIEQNPSHTYLTEGVFTVTLTVSNEFGEDSLVKENLITVLPPEIPGKSFTFGCKKNLIDGGLGFERLELELGGNERCKIKLTHLEPGVSVDVSTHLRTGLNSSIKVSPMHAVTDANGELEVVITAVKRGVDWVAWAVPNKNGEFVFNKEAYNNGLAWGMFVEVK